MGNPVDFSNVDHRLATHRGIGMNHSTWRTNGKTIFFIRHAEAEHNVPISLTVGALNELASTSGSGEASSSTSASISTTTNQESAYPLHIRDPRLTQTGTRQAQRIPDLLPADARANATLILTSPLRRCIQTCLIAFGRQISWHASKLMILPELQEIGTAECDRGSTKETLMEDFPMIREDIDQLGEHWFEKPADDDKGRLLELEQGKERVQSFKKWLIDRSENVIIVVTHNGFLRELLGDELWLGSPRNSVNTPEEARKVGLENAEVRRVVMSLDGESWCTLRGITVLEETFNNELEAVGSLGW